MTTLGKMLKTYTEILSNIEICKENTLQDEEELAIGVAKEIREMMMAYICSGLVDKEKNELVEYFNGLSQEIKNILATKGIEE